MAKPRKQDPAGIPVQAPTIPVDEYRGMGGSYIKNHQTGQRTRVAARDAGADSIAITEEEKADEIK